MSDANCAAKHLVLVVWSAPQVSVLSALKGHIKHQTEHASFALTLARAARRAHLAVARHARLVPWNLPLAVSHAQDTMGRRANCVTGMKDAPAVLAVTIC